MDVRRRQGFGWSVACSASTAAQLRAEIDATARHVDGLWSLHFPPEAGYEVDRRALEGGGERLYVRRGDFTGELEVAATRRHRGSLLRLSGRAGSRRIASTEAWVARWNDRLRMLGALAAAAGLMAGLSQMFVHPPGFHVDLLFLLGGLLVVVILLIVLVTGANLGAWLGEQVGAAAWGRSLAAVDADERLRGDLQRWRGLVRMLAQHRDALASAARRQPFRSPHVAPELAAEDAALAVDVPEDMAVATGSG